MVGKDPNDPMFPTKGGNALIVARMAKAVCNGDGTYPVCPVRDACLQDAMVTNQRFGIWGGLSEKQRQALKKKPRKQWQREAERMRQREARRRVASSRRATSSDTSKPVKQRRAS